MKKLISILTLFICVACGNTTQKNEKPMLTVTLEPLRYFTEDNFKIVMKKCVVKNISWR